MNRTNIYLTDKQEMEIKIIISETQVSSKAELIRRIIDEYILDYKKQKEIIVDYNQEVWKEIEGYENHYEVSTKGRVKSLKQIHDPKNGDKFLIPSENENGYFNVSLCKYGEIEKFPVHQLVATAFLINTENKPYVNHKDSNRQNNEIQNLEWVTPKENTQHSLHFGGLRNICGENNYQTKLKNTDIPKIREEYNTGNVTLDDLAEKYGVGRHSIWKIIRYKTWKHI